MHTPWLIERVECNTQYHNNFSVHESVRSYYPGVPEYIQVSEHHFVEQQVARLWVISLLLGWYVMQQEFATDALML